MEKGQTIFLASKITTDGDCSHEIRSCLLLGRKAMTNLDSILKSRDITLQTKVHLVKAMVFSSSQIWMWELDHKEGWALKNCDTGEDSWESLGRTDAEAETPVLWPPDAKNWLIWKDSDAGKDWRWEEKGTTDAEMVGWHHRFKGDKLQQTPGGSEEQRSLACCSPWGHKESDTT